jgi:hypothetical protein
MMTDRSLNLVVWRVRVASDYRLISTKSSILDALCGAELLMSADDSGATPTGAVRRRLSLQVYPGLLRHGYSAQNSQTVFWLFAVLCTHSDPLADDLKRRFMLRLWAAARPPSGRIVFPRSLPTCRPKGEPDADSFSCRPATGWRRLC